MNTEHHDQIYNELNLRETEDLIEIWQANDHEEWTDTAFEVVKKILIQRLGEIPSQEKSLPEEPVPEQEEYDETDKKSYDFSKSELKIIDDDNPPDFYDPIEVLNLSKWFDWAIKATIALNIVYNLLIFPTSRNIAQSYFLGNPNSIFAYLLALLIFSANIAIGILLTYFPLKALAHILRILMEMEFRSRKGI